MLSKDMEVTDLAYIRTEYVKRLTEFEVEDPQSYSLWKLKQRLMNHFGRKLVFIERSGCSALVCSSVTMVGDALQKASYMDDSNKDIEFDDLDSRPTQLDDAKV